MATLQKGDFVLITTGPDQECAGVVSDEVTSSWSVKVQVYDKHANLTSTRTSYFDTDELHLLYRIT